MLRRILSVSLIPFTACGGSETRSLADGPTSGGIDSVDASSFDGSSTVAGLTDSSADTELRPGSCETVLCGAELTCCGVGQDCVHNRCVAQCASGVRCGDGQDECCPTAAVCLAGACEQPTGECLDSFDCEFDEFCEPTLARCLPQFEPVACAVVPDFEAIAVTREWAYTDGEVISIPVVADIDGDARPDVVLNLTQRDGQGWPGGAVVALDGVTGAQKWRIDDDPGNGRFGSHGRSSLGLSDVSGDGLPDVIYAGRGPASLIHAVDGQGNLLWSSHDADGTAHRFTVENGAPAFANFDQDPQAEIVFGASLLDHDGRVVWDQANDGARYGSNGTYFGGISAVVDLNGDGAPEIVSGRHAWGVAWGPTVTVTPVWDAGGPDGYPAVADLDGDGDPEVILVAEGTVRVLDGTTGQAWCGVDPTDAMCQVDASLRTRAVAIPGGGIGGPPTVADFDGDGRPEIAAAGGSSYTVYDINRAGEELVVAMGFSPPELGQLVPRWTAATQDQSSNTTGSSVFDFQGDGAAEVVYADECYMRVYDGATGEVRVQIESSSATIHEYPLVVDVDADGNSEILVVANVSEHSCGHISGYTPRRGLYVYGDQFDRWVGTRRVWPSHNYHVTNATSAGNVPVTEVDNWTDPSLNNYRQNVQGAGAFNAPDLTVELLAKLEACIDDELILAANVRNSGDLGVGAGVAVSLYRGADASGDLVGTELTTVALLPGQVTQITWAVGFAQGGVATEYFVAVDGVSAANGTVVECNEENNTAVALSAYCPVPG